MKKVRLYGNTLKEQLVASRRDRLHHFTLSGGSIRGVVLNATRMVNEMRWNHELGILETLVLGHAYIGAALMASGLKGGDRLGLQVDCSGPIRGLSVEANAFGEVRGYLKQVPIPIDKPLESFDLSPFFGAGFLSVTKVLEDAKQPFTGKVTLEHGRLAKDLAHYHLQSEQLATAFSLNVAFDRNGGVTGAGGLMLQVMPGADDQTLAELENCMAHLTSLGKAVHAEDFPNTLLQATFGAHRPRLLESKGVEFMCHCNRNRIGAMLAMLKVEEIEDMAANGPFPVKIRCHHCNTTFEFSQEQIRKILHMRHSHS
jgi:molecular chaperone Hsp33